jgi:hypothetical protein
MKKQELLVIYVNKDQKRYARDRNPHTYVFEGSLSFKILDDQKIF